MKKTKNPLEQIRGIVREEISRAVKKAKKAGKKEPPEPKAKKSPGIVEWLFGDDDSEDDGDDDDNSEEE